MGDTGVRRTIIDRLSSAYPGVYTKNNVAFVATHSHAGVGGYPENLLPQVTSLGYVKQTADAIVAGTVRAVQRAHGSLAPGKLSLGNATVLNANINRSPTAYLANPAEERARYAYDVDKEMTVLRFDDAAGSARGFLSFFPVHGTSLYGVSKRRASFFSWGYADRSLRFELAISSLRPPQRLSPLLPLLHPLHSLPSPTRRSYTARAQRR